MKNKYSFFPLFVLGLILINLEFMASSLLSFFSVISVVIMTPVIMLSVLAMKYPFKSEWKLYALTVTLMYIYGLYAGIYQVYIIIVTVILVWSIRNYVFYLRRTDLLVSVFTSYFIYFVAITGYFVFAYNLNINIGYVFIVNTLVSTTLNSLLCYIFMIIFIKDEEEDDQ